ncbi:haloacid dehalogenase type II [Telmatospirillum siberiense]|uniref:(S)-2-haloacid dehalogenase n=2 Tax=Telmatospirillum siberiense TaxID=382514 RepID=A0A2N3PLS0_9PROT|nr:haloacid dehalogenase type II [Telmatospirillum siberiense]
MSGVSVCAFDAYGTLFDIKAVVDSSRAALGPKADALVDLWRRKQLEYSWLRSLMGRHSDFWHVTGESLDYAFKALDIDDASLRARLMESYLCPNAYPEAKATLQSLKTAGYKLAILSNGSPSMLTSATKAAGLDDLFDVILSVESVGIYKPHPTAYRLVTDHFECQPAGVAFLSSNGWDAAGGSAFGFQVVWVNRAGQPREVLPAAAHAEVSSLTALPELFRL